MPDKANIVVASQSFIGGLGKDDHYVTAGDLFSADDPLVKRYPKLFGAVTLRESSPILRPDEPRVEQATAAPGEKRSFRRKPAAKKAAKPEPIPVPEPEPEPEPKVEELGKFTNTAASWKGQ